MMGCPYRKVDWAIPMVRNPSGGSIEDMDGLPPMCRMLP